MEAIPITALTYPPVQLLSADSELAHFLQAASISSALLINSRSSNDRKLPLRLASGG
jgi:hypothetical protein